MEHHFGTQTQFVDKSDFFLLKTELSTQMTLRTTFHWNDFTQKHQKSKFSNLIDLQKPNKVVTNKLNHGTLVQNTKNSCFYL